MEIPLSMTLWGTPSGWSWRPCCRGRGPRRSSRRGPPPPALHPFPGPPGAYAWPVWYPLPEWLPAGSWRLGLATGLAGGVAGMAVLRVVRFLFAQGRGIEGLGVGDADLMMMAGAFIGWQPVVVAFFLVGLPGLVFASSSSSSRAAGPAVRPVAVAGRDDHGPGWPAIGPQFQALFFEPFFIGPLAAVGAIALLAASFLLRLVMGNRG